MSTDQAAATRKLPGPGEPFNPREVFGSFGFGLFIPERIAASTVLSMTDKVCYGHLLRRAGKNDRCWPSYRDIAESTGLQKRQAKRAVKALVGAQLIRSVPRSDESGRQTSNGYEFIWGPILQGEGDRSDTLPRTQRDTGRGTDKTPTRESETTPLEAKNINHHQGSNTQGSSEEVESTDHAESSPQSDRPPSQRADDAARGKTEYASGKDELKAIYFAKTGESFRVADLDAIESILFGASITWETFVADIRGHSWERIRNPIGFLKNRAKHFHALNRTCCGPVTASEAADRDYRCNECGSTVRGEGVLIGADREWVPCKCASPEYVARQRARGVFRKETA